MKSQWRAKGAASAWTSAGLGASPKASSSAASATRGNRLRLGEGGGSVAGGAPGRMLAVVREGIFMRERYRYGWLVTGALLMAIGVMAGAFGAHALRAHIPAEAIAIYQTGVLYHMVHALAIIALGGLRLALGPAAGVREGPLQRVLGRSCAVLCFGTIVFSGSLYALVLTGERWLGMVTPIGGLAFIAGWLLLAGAVPRAASTHEP